MRILNIDVETFSTVDIKAGVKKYCTEVELLLLAYSLDGKPVRVIDVAQGEAIPDEFIDALFDEKVLKTAWNAAFEIEVLEKHFCAPMKLAQWSCTMVMAARCGYPLSLDKAAKAIGLPIEKDTAGKSLIRLFSVPRKPTKTNPATRIYPQDNPEKWESFKAYNIKDVEVEMAIRNFFLQYPAQPHFEHVMYVLDRTINKRGLEIDVDFVKSAIKIDEEYKAILTEEAKELTGLDNPNSVTQLKAWLEARLGIGLKGLDKATLKALLSKERFVSEKVARHALGTPGYEKLSKIPSDGSSFIVGYTPPEWLEERVTGPTVIVDFDKGYVEEPVTAPVQDGMGFGTGTHEIVGKNKIYIKDPETVLQVLKLRKELSNTSVKKYVAMLNSQVGGRVYDTIQFNGAGRTGRNAGRIIQPQNMPRVYLEDSELDLARRIVKLGNLETLEMCFDSVSGTLSQLIRTAISSKEGKHLKVVDLSAIEARVLAWLAGEEHVLEVFRTHGKIYEATASMMFKVPFDTITKGSIMRQRGKVASLACGYQGGPNAITTMDLDKSIPDEEKPGLVKAWRDAHPNTVRYWYSTQNAAIKAIKNPGERVPLSKGAYFVVHKDALLFYLPSGRYLMYPKVGLEEGKYGEKIVFWGLDQITGQWKKQDTYGGKLVENETQAVARDVLMEGMLNMVRAGYDLVTNVHDETVCETDTDFGSVAEIKKLMCTMPAWADGLPLAAEGFESDYYKK